MKSKTVSLVDFKATKELMQGMIMLLLCVPKKSDLFYLRIRSPSFSHNAFILYIFVEQVFSYVNITLEVVLFQLRSFSLPLSL